MATLRKSLETVITSADGSVTVVKQQVWNLPTEEEYIRLYSENILKLLIMFDTKPSAAKVLVSLLKRTPFCSPTNYMAVEVTKEVRLEILREVGLSSVSVLDNAIKYLVDNEFVFRTSKAHYTPNPFLFSKGKSAEIKKLRLSLQNSTNVRVANDEPIQRQSITLSEKDKKILKQFQLLLELAKVQKIERTALQKFKNSLPVDFGFDKIPEWCWYFV